jgi:hypothetical protein
LFLYRLVRRAIELIGVHHLNAIEKDVETVRCASESARNGGDA